MTTPPLKHRWVETDDGSRTLFSEEFQEACHSSSGARAETLLHYVNGCKVLQRAPGHEPFIILEAGFGTGLGFLMTREALGENKGRWHFISVEIDRGLVDWWMNENPGHEWKTQNVCELVTPSYTLTIIVGDARKTLPRFMTGRGEKFHAIYQDAFSPKRNPLLWTKEWFSFLRDHSSEDVILSTYSSSSSIRKSLHEAGWKLQKGEKFGPKRSSTRAYLKGESDEEILFHLSRSPVMALTDGNAEGFKK